MPTFLPHRNDLHAAPKTDILQRASDNNVQFVVVRLQKSKTDSWFSLHVRPSTWTTSGMQTTDVLDYLGFERSTCAYVGSECYVQEVAEDFDLTEFVQSFATITNHLQQAQQHLAECGIYLDEPQGNDFFLGRVTRRQRHTTRTRGDGHTASKVERLKEDADDNFHYVLSWIDGIQAKGWTTHYRAIHPPLSPNMKAAFDFLDMRTFENCPEFDFEPCTWKFMPFQEGQYGSMDSNARDAHSVFGAHKSHFSAGIEELLAGDLLARRFGLAILPLPRLAATDASADMSQPNGQHVVASATTNIHAQSHRLDGPYKFEVAISFAGPQRELAEQLANILRQADCSVFYDSFYPEQLWGKDLTAFFDNIYRKESRYCVIFVSEDYAQRMWTSHEHRSARARALEQMDTEYILPIRVDDAELAGMPPTIGYLSLAQYSVAQISEILLDKLKSS